MLVQTVLRFLKSLFFMEIFVFNVPVRQYVNKSCNTCKETATRSTQTPPVLQNTYDSDLKLVVVMYTKETDSSEASQNCNISKVSM